MIAFYREYPNPTDFLPQPAAKLESTEKLPQAAAKLPDATLWSIPWFHQIVLMEKVKNRTTRLWYMHQTLTNGWSRNILLAMIQSKAHSRQGQASHHGGHPRADGPGALITGGSRV